MPTEPIRRWLMNYICVLGICGTKGAPLPRLCFAQLALDFCSYYLCYEKCYVHTDKLTPINIKIDMRMFDQASHSIWNICTCNHDVVVFYDTSSVVIFPHNKDHVCDTCWSAPKRQNKNKLLPLGHVLEGFNQHPLKLHYSLIGLIFQHVLWWWVLSYFIIFCWILTKSI